WYQRNFSDPQAVNLLLFLLFGFLIVLFMGEMLAPALASIVIAYMLEAVVIMLVNRSMPRLVAVSLVCLVFFFSLLAFILLMVPVLSHQVTQLVQELPNQIDRGQQSVLMLPDRYPELVSESQIKEIMSEIRGQIAKLGQDILSISLASIPILFALMIYLVLVPLLVFLFLKDKVILLNWFKGYLPQQRNLANQVWKEMDEQIGNYVRGKFTEILIVGGVTYLGFVILGLNYAALLAVLVGISVIVPYIGAAVVTVPVAMIAYFQWGWTANFAYLMAVYGIIQAIDGNVIVPLLFSEAVNLHPTAIILAVLVFGGLWGLWGVFFAIPLATLVKAVLNAWPSKKGNDQPEPEGA
ncbi:MAG: AI-2E family transporter, partial [Thiohalomonadales bacterium]